MLLQKKCARYWPDTATKEFGKISVNLKETKKCAFYVVRKMDYTIEQVSK